jgi:hypothetical protein
MPLVQSGQTQSSQNYPEKNMPKTKKIASKNQDEQTKKKIDVKNSKKTGD